MKTRYKLITILGITMILTGFTAAFEGGDGSSSDPYQISTCQELQDMQNDLSANYVLVNDVDCSSFTGFSSVGDSSNIFSGVLDGQNFTVDNLTINEGSSQYVGLIGYLDGGEVKDIGVVNADVSGSKYVGGLVGFNYASVSSSYSTGSVSGGNVGGLVGYNHDSVSSSYSTASVSGGNVVGGLVGRNYRGSVSSSYSTGSVSGSSDVGGLVGYNYDSSVSSSYWDTESSGLSSSAGSATGLTTSEMTYPDAESNMAFNFGNSHLWLRDDNNINSGYPILCWQENNCKRPPSASFASNSPVLTGEDLGLDASGSSDPDGDSLTYEWDTNDDGVYGDKTGVNPSVSKPDNGSYSIGLNVTDGNGGSDAVSQTVQVNNRDPVADFSFSPSAPTVGESVSFDGSLSSDSDGSIQLFEWDWTNDGTYESTGESPSNSFGSIGDQTVELRVTDDDGSTNTTTKTVSVGAISLSVDWSGYSSATEVDGFRVYYGVGGVDESNMVEVGSSVDSKQISDNSWSSGDNVCVEVRPYNSNGEASSDEQCVNLS